LAATKTLKVRQPNKKKGGKKGGGKPKKGGLSMGVAGQRRPGY